MSTVHSTLKRKGSLLIDNMNHKNPRTSAQIFVPKPTTLLALSKCPIKELREAMHVDDEQFDNLTKQLRSLAHEGLDVDFRVEEQDENKIAKLIAEACEQEPLWRQKFEDAWPIGPYITRFLYRRASDKHNLTNSVKKNRDSYYQSVSSTGVAGVVMQSFTPRSTNPALQSNDSQDAVQVDESEYEHMQPCLAFWAKKHLDNNTPWSAQKLDKQRALEEDAKACKPLFPTNFEVDRIPAYMERYLNERMSTEPAQVHPGLLNVIQPQPVQPSMSPNALVPICPQSYRSPEQVQFEANNETARPRNPSSQTGAEQSSATPLLMTQTARTNNCAYRYPPMQPAHSQFTWSPADFSSTSSSAIASTRVQARVAVEEAASPPRTCTSSADNHPTHNKENAPPSHAPPAMSALDDPSAPVKEFLRSLNPSLEHLVARFCELGIENLETLLAFKTWSAEEQEKLLKGELNKFQILAVQNFLLKA